MRPSRRACLHPFPDVVHPPDDPTVAPVAANTVQTSRRDFFKRAGFGLGALTLATSLQACDSGDPMEEYDVVLDFSSDVGVLNYAYALEQLEAAFYATVVGDAAFQTTFPIAAERSILRDRSPSARPSTATSSRPPWT